VPSPKPDTRIEVGDVVLLLGAPQALDNAERVLLG
jgi:Trk K+ transport system NAD-binding subunit